MDEEFHSTYANEYGYGGRINDIRDKEFPNLQDIVYLDHTGSTLYAKSQLQSYHEDLLKNTYGNPHSSCLSSELSSQVIEDIRQDILSFFKTTSEKYQVIFTSNATNALKLVAENFKFDAEAREGNSSSSCSSWFVYLQDNHTSVVGIRANASSKGAQVRPVTHEESLEKKLNLDLINYTQCSHDYISPDVNDDKFEKCNNLFAFPAMSNFSGRKYPLEWIDFVQNNSPFSKKVCGKWFVILDAASYISTSGLDLCTYQPDFVPISFYKLFGFPTGLGALLVSVRGSAALKKTYFGGGTVSAYSSDTNFHVFKSTLQDRYKDGTPPFLEILSLRYGFEMLAKLTVTMDLVNQHTFCLAQFVYNKLKELRHYNGKEACRLYSDTRHKTSSDQGPIINFNILRSNGDYVGYSEVSSLAAIYNIHLRTGCFCNVGACQHFLELTSAQLESNLKAGHVCGDEIDLIDGRPTGSVRISFGYMSDFSDAKRFITFIEECFLEKLCASFRSETELTTISKNKQVLRRMFIYPIKSCAAFEVYQWDINERGFCYDREWVIVNQSGTCLSQKRESRLCLIKPSIDLKSNVLRIEAPGMLPFLTPLDMPSTDVNTLIIQPRICGSRISGIDCGDEVSEWLTLFLEKKCRLLRQNPNVTRKSMLSKGASEGCTEHAISLTNESQLLIITETSCADLLSHVETSISSQETHELTLKKLTERFRPNLVVNGMSPYEEESWCSVAIGDNRFECCGVCHRCQMICIDQTNGERSMEPLRTLAKIRGSQILFGVHLLHVSSDGKTPLAVGDVVQPTNSS